jgi:hypothetical protein
VARTVFLNGPEASRAIAVRKYIWIFLRDKGDYLEISRVLDRKEAYR